MAAVEGATRDLAAVGEAGMMGVAAEETADPRGRLSCLMLTPGAGELPHADPRGPVSCLVRIS